MHSRTTIRSSARSWRKIERGSLYVVGITLVIFFLFPILWSALNSLKTPAEMLAVPPIYLPSSFSLENYRKVIDHGYGLFHYVFNSAAVAIFTIIGAIVLSTLAGYGFSRFDFPFKNALFVLVLVTLMIPFQSILVPIFFLFVKVKLSNTLLGLALVYITFQLPFGIFVMRNTFDMVPREIEEAALLDGCNTFDLLWRVMLIPVRPGIITVAIFAFINSWNEFLAALILMSDDSKYTMPIMLTSVATGQGHSSGFGTIDWGALQAGVMVNIIPCLVLFLFLQRYYIKGLMGGSVK